MQLNGTLFIGQQQIVGQAEPFYAVNPADNQKLEPAFGGATIEQVDQACQLAADVFDHYRNTDLQVRATFLETIAQQIEAIGEPLILRAMQETGLPRARLEGERARTCGQLRLFANKVRQGEWLDVRIDSALPERQPLPRQDIRQQQIAVGPVAVFGASNFPLAFSVAGGDTASALAAGCPVIVKAHSSHPGTSELVAQAIQLAVKICQLPEGVFSLLQGRGHHLGTRLVGHSAIKAVGFTGSRGGGMSLMQVAQNRAEPIPVYAEMSSINPVILLEHALSQNPVGLAQSFVQSLTFSAGQLCTNPGLVIAIKSQALTEFKEAAAQAIEKIAAQTMLSPSIYQHYEKTVAVIAEQAGTQLTAQGQKAQSDNQGQAFLFHVPAAEFMRNLKLQTEAFGATSLIVECDDFAQVQQVLKLVEGQLTITLHMLDADLSHAQTLLPVLERKAGRILVNGWPTGVEVCDAIVHGGPFPATSDSRTTSVGTAAMLRFLRPVCYQNFPEGLLPTPIQHKNPLHLSRLIDGVRHN